MMKIQAEVESLGEFLAPSLADCRDSVRGGSIINHGRTQLVHWVCDGKPTYSFISDVVAAKPDAKNWPQSYFTLVNKDATMIGRFLAKGCSGSCGSVFLRAYFAGEAREIDYDIIESTRAPVKK